MSKFSKILLTLSLLVWSINCQAWTFDSTNPPLEISNQSGSIITFPYRLLFPAGSLTDTLTASVVNFVSSGGSGFVPYIGAVGNVDLGLFNLTTTGTGQFASMGLGTLPVANVGLAILAGSDYGLVIYEGVGEKGIQISGYDDRSSDNFRISVDSGGSAYFQATKTIQFYSGSSPYYIFFSSGSKIYFDITGTDGTNKNYFRSGLGNIMTLDSSGKLVVYNNLTVGSGAAGVDYTLTFNGENNNNGVITWMEDEDYFAFSDSILMNTTEPIYFRDTAIYTWSSADGWLNLVADTGVEINSTVLNTPHIYATDGTRWVDIVDGTYGVEAYIPDNGYAWYSHSASDGDYIVLHNGAGNLAAFFSGSTSMSVLLCDGTRSIYATGNVYITASAAQEVLGLNQADNDQAFIDFAGTSAADTSKSITTRTVAVIVGYIRVEINGTTQWIPYYATPSA